MFEGVLDVKASAGNNHLGGGDFDRLVADWLATQFEAAHGVELRRDLKAMVRLKAAAEQAKIELSSMSTTTILLPFVAVKGGEPLSLEAELSRRTLEELVGPLVRSTLEPIETALRDAKLDRSRITDVVLVGGSSRMPLVQSLLSDYFGREARRGVHPDEAIALGAAVQAGLKSGAISTERGIMITDVCPFTLGVEVVASAGSQKLGGMFSPIIPRNSTVPVSRTEVYSTTGDQQRVVDIKVYQGESRLTKNNTFLDSYSIDGIPPALAGHEKVAITFTYDVNGILNCKTRVVSTGKEALLVVDKSAQRLSDGERASAKQRLQREWKPTAPGATSAATSTATATAGSEAPLVAAALAKLASADAGQRVKLEALVARLKAAATRGDAAELARADGELTNYLFELD
jgi:molecular chaperone DnaK